MIARVPPFALSDLHPGLRLADPARPLIGVEKRGTAGAAARGDRPDADLRRTTPAPRDDRVRGPLRRTTTSSQPGIPPAPARSPCRRPLPGEDQASARSRRPPQRMRAGRVEAQVKTGGRVLEPTGGVSGNHQVTPKKPCRTWPVITLSAARLQARQGRWSPGKPGSWQGQRGNGDRRLAVIRAYRRAGTPADRPRMSGPLTLSAHFTRGDGEDEAGPTFGVLPRSARPGGAQRG